MRIRVLWSLARLSEMEGRSAAALRYARRAITLLEATEDDLQAARAHVLAAWIMNSSGDPAGARGQLARAEELFGESGSVDDVALLKVESARAAARLGDGGEAVALAREALAAIGDQYGAVRGTALWALAEGHAESGELSPAVESFAAAVDVLSEHSRWREASEACRAWAGALRRAGRDEQALDVLERASELALRTHAGSQTLR
jgi:tetratricopeptide (TPR) repeat protein